MNREETTPKRMWPANMLAHSRNVRVTGRIKDLKISTQNRGTDRKRGEPEGTKWDKSRRELLKSQKTMKRRYNLKANQIEPHNWLETVNQKGTRPDKLQTRSRLKTTTRMEKTTENGWRGRTPKRRDERQRREENRWDEDKNTKSIVREIGTTNRKTEPKEGWNWRNKLNSQDDNQCQRITAEKTQWTRPQAGEWREQS